MPICGFTFKENDRTMQKLAQSRRSKIVVMATI
jgi:hypothetical protein